MDDFSGIPKYRKKSQSKPPKKTKHKHDYELCVLEYPTDWYKKEYERSGQITSEVRSFCTICCKIGPVDQERWIKRVKRTGPSGDSYIEHVPTEELLIELDPNTRTLPTISVDGPFTKSCWSRTITVKG